MFFASAGDVAAKQSDTGQLRDEPLVFEQVKLLIEEAVDVAGIRLSRHKFVQVGCILVILLMTIAPGQQLEDG